MKQSKISFAAVLVFTTFLGAIGQLLFKIGVSSNGVLLLALYVLAGLFSYVISTVFYLYILSRTHLSWAYGFGGLSYLFTTILAFFVLMENVPPLRWAGVFVIFIGVTLIGIS